MAYPDPGPLLDEHLDELEIICRSGEGQTTFGGKDADECGLGDGLGQLDYVLGWIDRHARQVLEASRWALEHGYQRPPMKIEHLGGEVVRVVPA